MRRMGWGRRKCRRRGGRGGWERRGCRRRSGTKNGRKGDVGRDGRDVGEGWETVCESR